MKVLRLGLKDKYVTPCVNITSALPEGIVCASFNVFRVEVDEIHNMNTVTEPEYAECFDFEF